MEIKIDDLNFGRIHPDHLAGAKAIIELSMGHAPKNAEDLIKQIEAVQPAGYTHSEIRLYKYLAVSALARSGVPGAAEILRLR